MTTTKSAAAITTAFDGREYLGCLLPRPGGRCEAFDAADNSIGEFADQAEAASALWRRHHGQAKAAS